jgi:hypothetical protein
MKGFPRYSLLSWIEAIVNMAHAGAVLLALVFLIVGLSLLAWFPTVAKVFLVLSLILITVQIASRIRFIRKLRIIRHVQGEIKIFDRPSNKWLPGSRIKKITKREFSHSDPWRPLTVGFPGIEVQLEGVTEPVAVLYPYGLEDERDRMYVYLRNALPQMNRAHAVNEPERFSSKTSHSAPQSARPLSANVVQKDITGITRKAIIFSACCAIGIISLSIWLRDFWILSALFGVLLVYSCHSPAPNMIAGGIVILGSIVLGVAGMFLSKPLQLVSISLFFIWLINNALTGVSAMRLHEKNKDAEQSTSGDGHYRGQRIDPM